MDEMKKNYKNSIIELEDKANKLIEEMNGYLNLPTNTINSDIHFKFEKKTKNNIDQLKLLVEKATEEYNNVSKLYAFFFFFFLENMLTNIYYVKLSY